MHLHGRSLPRRPDVLVSECLKQPASARGQSKGRRLCWLFSPAIDLSPGSANLPTGKTNVQSSAHLAVFFSPWNLRSLKIAVSVAYDLFLFLVTPLTSLFAEVSPGTHRLWAGHEQAGADGPLGRPRSLGVHVGGRHPSAPCCSLFRTFQGSCGLGGGADSWSSCSVHSRCLLTPMSSQERPTHLQRRWFLAAGAGLGL